MLTFLLGFIIALFLENKYDLWDMVVSGFKFLKTKINEKLNNKEES